MMITRAVRRFLLIAGFALYFLKEVVVANLRVAWEILMIHRHTMRPGIVAIPLDARTDLEISLLANLITLTPGTLTIDVSTDRKFLYIHEMYLGEVARFKDFERRLLRVMR
jgi:multicomponent Na+:H+ antiporter subunit E